MAHTQSGLLRSDPDVVPHPSVQPPCAAMLHQGSSWGLTDPGSLGPREEQTLPALNSNRHYGTYGSLIISDFF